ncbi:MAG: hypothetical protein WC692_07405 [Erythrobacter sp.]|jgi:hypothetical protein
MAEAADLEGGLVAYLGSVALLAALVDIWVFGGELPARMAKDMPRKAIVVKASGGVSLTGQSYLDHDTQRVDVFAFGETPREAARVMRVAALALRELRRSVHAGCLIHWVNAASGSLAGREPVTEWPRQFQSFQVMHGLYQVEE